MPNKVVAADAPSEVFIRQALCVYPDMHHALVIPF